MKIFIENLHNAIDTYERMNDVKVKDFNVYRRGTILEITIDVEEKI